MDQSPWKGECILGLWAGISNRSQSDLAAEGVSLSFPSHQLQCFSSRSRAGSARCAVGRDLPSLPRNKKSQGTFLVLVSSGCDGMREGLQVACGQRGRWSEGLRASRLSQPRAPPERWSVPPLSRQGYSRYTMQQPSETWISGHCHAF